MTEIAAQIAPVSVRWSVGGTLLEALATRDYERMATTLGSTIRFRALLPSGPMELEGSRDVAEAFRSWFGGADQFEVVDTVGEVGGPPGVTHTPAPRALRHRERLARHRTTGIRRRDHLDRNNGHVVLRLPPRKHLAPHRGTGAHAWRTPVR